MPETIRKPLIQKMPELPGTVYISETGEKVNILDRRQDAYYDTVTLAQSSYPYTITDNFSLDFFTNVSTKGKQFSSFTVDKKIVQQEQIKVYKLGLMPRLFYGNVRITDEDNKKVLESGYAWFAKNENKKKAGPCLFWPSGFGLAGATVESNDYFCSIGVPSPAAIPNLATPFDLVDTDTIEGKIEWPSSSLAYYTRPSISTPVTITMVIFGFIKRSGLRD